MPGKLSGAAAIVGAAEANQIGFLEEPVTALQLHIEAIKNLSVQTGVPIKNIEGVFSTGWSSELCEHLGIQPKYIDTTAVGGCSFEMHVHHAMAAIHAGIIDIALVSHGENGFSSRKIGGRGAGNYGRGGGVSSPGMEMTMAYGVNGAPSGYAHAMVRHMHRFGTTTEDFAHIAKVTRDWATLNPRAAMYSKEKHPFGGPITVQQVEESRLIAWPLTILHCCMVADHGGAVLVTSPKVAAGLKTKPVWIAGAGESMGHSNMMEMDDFTATSAHISAEAAYTMAGLGPSDMEMAQIYDSFTITAAITAEMLGLAPRGEGHTLWKDGHAAPGGKFPINTNGGGLSFNHSGMYGMPLLIEAYRQLSGTAEDGVNGDLGKQTSARTCVVNGTGGSLSTTGTLVLVADD
ncbi:MAG: thiolase [bacterium]|nr:thiolase [Gammaproteobacteria bacterium]HIL95979.1 thiolase [Pseudomonadales bacterium]